MIKRVFFDIDGTICSKDDEVRPGILELFAALHSAGIDIVLWSDGGLQYSQTWANRLDPEDLYQIKTVPKCVGMAGIGDAVVDDMLPVIELAHRLEAEAHKVSFFEPAIVKNDREMWKLLDIFVPS